MPLFNFFRARALLVGLLLLGAAGCGVIWLVDQDLNASLAFTRDELSALQPLEDLRSAMESSLEDQLSGAHPMASGQQSLDLCRGWTDQIKALGHERQLILDPQLDIFHLAYLVTVKLPERMMSEAELAELQARSLAKQERGRYLRESLTEQLKEETRALNLAQGDPDSPLTQSLKSQDSERQLRFANYQLGQHQPLADLVREDMRFWELCQQALEWSLRQRQASLVHRGHLRQWGALGILTLAFGLGWLLLRRSAEDEHSQALSISAQNYRTLYDTIPVAVFVYDMGTRSFSDANPAACKLLGLPLDQLVGQKLSSFIPEEDRPGFAEELRSRPPHADTHSFRTICSRSGRLFQAEIIARSIDVRGQRQRLVMLMDITEAKAAQELLKKNEARFRALVEDSSEALVLMQRDGRVAYASQSIQNVSGYSPEERIGSHSGGILHPEDRDQVWAVFEQAIQDPSRAYTFESRLLHKAGHYIHTAAKLRNFLGDPNIGALVLTYRDVSAEKEARQALAKSEEFYRALIENSQSLVVIYRTDRSVSYENPAAVKAILGYEPEEIAAFGAFDLVHPDDLTATLRQAESDLNRPGQTSQLEVRLKAKDGSWKTFDVRTIILTDNPVVSGVLVQMRDISASREAQKQLMRFERLAAIGQTAAGLAHEIRNPLAIIAARAEFLKMQLPDQAALLQDLDSILRQSDRLKTLVNEVLERSNSEDLDLAEASSQDLMESALKAAKLRFGPASDRLSYSTDFASPAPRLKADLVQMDRVLLNLILNAMQALPAGGTVTLRVLSGPAGATLQVSDNGPGIPEGKLTKIFDPFFTTKSTGSGLGLWICKSIVEQHGGRIEAQNLKPQGCCISVHLPQSAGAL